MLADATGTATRKITGLLGYKVGALSATSKSNEIACHDIPERPFIHSQISLRIMSLGSNKNTPLRPAAQLGILDKLS
jgi:hypothetical protein